jgi:hypothetical protein
MKTDTTKFLAVLAVFAMAFAGFAAIAVAEQNDAEDYSGDSAVIVLDDTTDQTGTGWTYSASTHTLTLTNATLDKGFYYNGNNELIVLVKGTNYVTADPVKNNSVFNTNGKNITIKPASGETNATLTVLSLNSQAGAISAQSGEITIGDSTASSANFTLYANGLKGLWGMGNDGQSPITINNSTVYATGSENAIKTMSTLTLVKSTVYANLDDSGIVNLQGDDMVFGYRGNSLVTDATSILYAQGMDIKALGTNDGTVYVTGGYVQMNYTKAFGIAGFLWEGSSDLTVQYSAAASGGAPGQIYVVEGADAYATTANLTVTGGEVTTKTETDKTTSADIVTAITNDTKVTSGVTSLIINLTSANAALNLDDLLKITKLKSLETLTIIGTTATLEGSALDVSDLTLKVSGATLTATVSNGSSNTANIIGLKGDYEIAAGSIKIAGSLDGTATIQVDGTFDFNGSVAANAKITVLPMTGKTAVLKTLNEITINAGGTLYLQDVYADFGGMVYAGENGTLYLGNDTVLADGLYMTGGKLTTNVPLTGNIYLNGTTVTTNAVINGNVIIGPQGATFNNGLVVDGDLHVYGPVIFTDGTDAKKNIVSVSGTTVIDNSELTTTLTVSIGSYVIATLGGLTEVSGVTVGENYITPTITIAANGKLTNPADGTITLDGEITGDGTFVNNGVAVIKGDVAKMTNNKTVRLYKATITAVENEGTIYIMDKNANITNRTGSGTIDRSAVCEECEFSGIISTAQTPFNENQIVTISKDTVLKSGAYVTFAGEVIIPEGVTLTIEDGAYMGVGGVFSKLTNNGTIVIEGKTVASVAVAPFTNAGSLEVIGGEVYNKGTITVSYSGTGANTVNFVINTGTLFYNYSTITVTEGSVVTNTAGIKNELTGEIMIQGTIGGTITNKGSVEVNSESIATLTVSNAGVAAQVKVTATSGTITVDDKSFTPKTGIKGTDVITISATNGTIGGLVIIQSMFKNADGKNVPELAISGTATLIASGETAPAGTLTFDGFVDVVDILSIGKGVTLTFADATTFVTVDGVLTIAADAADVAVTDGTPEIIVPGAIYSYKNLPAAVKISAAKYVIPATTEIPTACNVYTTFAGAVEQAAELEIATVTVEGNVDDGVYNGLAVLKDVTVPLGMTVKVLSGNLIVAEDVALTIPYSTEATTVLNLAEGAKIDVEGKLSFENMAKGFKGTKTDISSEVIVTSGTMVTYTTLAWAMADVGTEEATLMLCGPTVVKKDTTIPENITIDTNDQDFTVKDCVLTIDGALFLNGGTYTVTGDDAEIVLNGVIMKESKMEYDPDKKEYPAGLYFSTDDSSMYFIGNIDDAETYAVLADNNRLVYSGDLETAAINFDVNATLIFEDSVKALNMHAGSGAKITFKDDVTIVGSNLGACTLTFNEGIAIGGIFTSSVGAITFIDSVAEKTSTITVSSADVPVMTLTGDIGLGEEVEDYQVATLGDVTIKADLVELTVGDGTTTIAADCALLYFEVYGDLVVKAGYKVGAIAGLVYGSLIAEEATETAKAATVSLLYIGVGIEYDDSYVSSAATVSGDITVGLAFVGAGSDVSDSSIADMIYQTDVYVEDDLLLTAYAAAEDVQFMDSLKHLGISPSDPSAEPLGWFDEDGNDVDEDATVGQYDEIYALFDYNVYNVKIITDAGIKSVAINGVELENYSGNVFEVPSKLTAGTYKVTYTLKNGYSGEAVLSTSTGTILKDNSFVISPGSEKALTFQLAGTEPTPEPEPVTPEEQSEWTITTILLVILVILIAIMAVIVALRLNRN